MVVQGRRVFSRECVKLLDFGIAKIGDDADGANQKLTQIGLPIGTPRYMSPEQALGQKADARSDLYSCGVILYEMLTGRRPFEADATVELLSMHATATPKPLRSIAPEARIPAALENVILRTLAKRPDERFQSAGELSQALDRAARVRDGDGDISGLEQTMLAISSAPVQPASRWRRAALIAGLGIAVSLIADHHLPARAPGSGQKALSSNVSGSSGNRSRGSAEPDDASRSLPLLQPPTRPPPAAARAASQQPKRRTDQNQAVSKKKPRSR
jgi:serine/threonine protein kinase